jgi:zinc transporter ZupT
MSLVYLDAAQGLILILGGIVVFYAMRAYGRTKSGAMLLLALGFAFVTAGAAIAGVLYYATGDLTTAVSAQAASQVVGFFIIVYSLTRARS